MDTELYQILSLALLGLIALILLAVLSSLGRVRKALGERPGAAPAALPAPAETSQETAEPSEATEEREEEERPAATEPVASTIAEEPAVLSPGTRAAATPGPAAEAPSPVVTPEPQPAAETPSPEPAWDEQEEKYAAQYEPPATDESAEPEAAQPGMATGWAGAGLGATSGAGLGATSQPETTTPEPSSAEPEVAEPAPEDEPQEQPFERDGKWYFRRDNELLTYEETTGQWIPAGEGPATSPAAPSVANGGTSEGDTQELATGQDFGSGDTEEPITSAPASTGGGFWKCPSCGAVNGSTASTCRMCFTARP